MQAIFIIIMQWRIIEEAVTTAVISAQEQLLIETDNALYQANNRQKQDHNRSSLGWRFGGPQHK